MEKAVDGNTIAYKFDEETLYMITAITEVAGLLAATKITDNAKEHLDLIWEDSGVQKLIIFLPQEAEEQRAIARSLGFKQEGRLKKATPTGDMLIFGQYR